MDSIEQYLLNILWKVLLNVNRVLALLRNIHLMWRILRYMHYIMWTILRNAHTEHVENENFMCSKSFPLSISVPEWIHADCRWLLLAVSVCATVGLQSWAADWVLDRATTTVCCSCLVHWTVSVWVCMCVSFSPSVLCFGTAVIPFLLF